MIEKPYTGRSVIYRDGDTIEISVPSKKNWFAIIFLIAWLGGWTMGEVSAIGHLFYSDNRAGNTFMTFWLVGWTVGGVWAMLTLLWFISGKEIIIVDSGVLELGKQIFGLGRIKQYAISNIKLMVISPAPNKDKWGNDGTRSLIKPGLIEFDYGMKTIKFGSEFDTAEARMLIEIFKQNRNFNEGNFKETLANNFAGA